MEGVASTLINSILSGGVASTLAILVAVVLYLGYINYLQRNELKELRKTSDKNIIEVVNKYHEGQLSLIEAFNELKIILTVIKERG